MDNKTPFNELFSKRKRSLFQLPFFLFSAFSFVTRKNVHTEGRAGRMNLLDKLFWLYKNRHPIYEKNMRIKPHSISISGAGKKQYSVVLVGDLMLNTYLNKSQDKLYRQVSNLVFDADLTLGNMEFIKTDRISDDDIGIGYKEKVTPPKHFTKNLQESLLRHNELKYSGLNLSNNHIMDDGESAIEHTLEYLKKQEIKPIGVGKKPDDRITYFEIDDVKIAVVSFNFWSNYDNSKASEWSNIIESINEKKITQVDLEKIKAQMDLCKAQQPTKIIFSLHFGLEFEMVTRKHLIKNVHTILRANPEIDLVWGHHPHVIQPYEIFESEEKKVPIFYSIGNLTHPFSAPQCTLSNVLRINLDEEGEIINVDITPVNQFQDKEEGFLELRALQKGEEIEINETLYNQL